LKVFKVKFFGTIHPIFSFKKEYMKRNIELSDDRGALIEASLERLYQKNGIRMEGDISWLTDINPNERKTFKIFVSDYTP